MPPRRVLFLSWGLGMVMCLPASIPAGVLRLLTRNDADRYLMWAAICAALLMLAWWPFWCRHVLQSVMRSEHPEARKLRAALLGATGPLNNHDVSDPRGAQQHST